MEALGGGRGPLVTISLVYERMRVLARERPLIEGLARGRAGVEPRFIAGDGLLNFASYADPAVTGSNASSSILDDDLIPSS